MREEQHRPQEILRENRPLIGHIVAITSQRRRLSESEQEALSELVESTLIQPDPSKLGGFRGTSSLKSYLAVLVQKLCQAMRSGSGADVAAGESSPLADAMRQTTSMLPSSETLVAKMWFESGMTTQKIAMVLGMRPADVHAVVAKRTDRVQDWLARSRTSSLTTPTAPAADETA